VSYANKEEFSDFKDSICIS